MAQETITRRGALNGVDLDRLFGTIEAVKADPALARFRFKTKNTWVRGGRNRTEVEGFHGAGQEVRHARPFVLDNDEPEMLLGEDEAANPVEQVLHALAGCLTTSLVYHAAARGVRLDAVESTFEGELDLRGFLGLSDEVRRGYERVRVHFRVKADAPEERLAELIEAAKAHSPVFDIVTNPTPVEVTVSRLA